MLSLKSEIGSQARFSYLQDLSKEDIWQKTEKYFPRCRSSILNQLEMLRDYSPNWDGYGAKPLSPEILSAVRGFLEKLPDEMFIRPHTETHCLLPFVVPMSSGSIQLEWHVANRILELEFEGSTIIHYLKWWPQEMIEEEDTYQVVDYRQSYRLIEWVQSGYEPE